MIFSKIFLYLLVVLLAGESVANNKIPTSDIIEIISSSDGSKNDPLNLKRYLVSLRRRSEEVIFGASHYCSGAIIRDDVIVTAASCLYKDTTELIPANDLLVVAGCQNRLDHTADVQIMSVRSVLPHYGYCYPSIAYDIGLLILEGKLLIDNRTVGIVSLPTKQAEDGMSCNLLDWGRAYQNGPRRESLINLDMILYLSEDCAKKNKALNVDKLCAINKADNASDIHCPDRGSPLFCNGIIYGLTSFDVNCDSQYLSTFYEIVLQHVEWIQGVANNEINDGTHDPSSHFNQFLSICSKFLIGFFKK